MEGNSNSNEEKLPKKEGAIHLESVQFEDLAKGASEVLVLYNGQVYRLRATRNGKLILNK